MALDAAISDEKQQMKQYCKIGKTVNQKRERSATVASAEGRYAMIKEDLNFQRFLMRGDSNAASLGIFGYILKNSRLLYLLLA